MKLKKTIYCLAFFVFALYHQPAAAQEEFIDPPSRNITTIPFIQLSGGIIIIQARLDPFPDTMNFVLDTGSSGISLDSATVAYLGLKPTPTERTIRGIAGIRKVSFLYNRKLYFPGLTVDSLNFHINDYSILTAVYGERIDGIMGYAVLSRYIIKLNYDSSKVTFATKGTIRYPRNGYLLKPDIGQLVTQPLRVRDEKTIHSRFLFDIGAGLCVLFSRDFIDDSLFLDKKRKRYLKEGEGLGGKIDMEQTVIKEVKVGPYRFRNVPVFIFNDEYNVTSYPNMGGLLGNGIMRRFNVILNYARGDIFISPNSHYADPFDYSYTGLELYLINRIIIVGDVAKGSPAEAAGLQEGDEVIAVNKQFNQNLNQYKIAIQTPNEKIRLILRRDGVIFELEFKVKNILR
ncbi:MAG: PDZ domain-containing protein [Bacteroidetes bacterium]|nr:PDZ domain-containing protein [Bacteroidota bacterium]